MKVGERERKKHVCIDKQQAKVENHLESGPLRNEVGYNDGPVGQLELFHELFHRQLFRGAS
jgi:hypothetical protein